MKAPHVFQNGFVANRIARHEQKAWPLSVRIQVASFRQGKGVFHMVEKDENGAKTYWVDHATGFIPWVVEGDR
jgi:hypothetical protein